MCGAPAGGTLNPMAPTTYAVTWQNGEGLHSGKAELRAKALHLDATDDHLEVRYEDLSGVSIARAARERIAGRPTLVLERRDGGSVRLASIAQLGIVSELAERLAALHLGHLLARHRIVVVLPLREGVHDEVCGLLDRGPPFDPEQAGLRQHQVFLTDHEVVFFFDTLDERALERFFSDTNVWAAAGVWGEYAGGPVRIGDETYAWAKSADANGYTA
jgi:hypothetical protein